MKIVLANVDYRNHMTNEGNQFQLGLESAGWKLVGPGYDGLKDVREIMERYQPSHVVVHDKRDWDKDCPISFRADISYENLESIKDYPAKRFVVVKDAGTFVDYHKQFVDEVEPDGVIIYYHEKSVCEFSPFLRGRNLIRTYHSIDRDEVAAAGFPKERRRGLVSGAKNTKIYPERARLMHCVGDLGIDVMWHPGYGNKGSLSGDFLKKIAGYKTHICTCSIFKFALRKIIESISVGTTVVTNLPRYDKLPVVDGFLKRVNRLQSIPPWRDAVWKAAREWSCEEKREMARQCVEFYDYRNIGRLLSEKLVKA